MPWGWRLLSLRIMIPRYDEPVGFPVVRGLFSRTKEEGARNREMWPFFTKSPSQVLRFGEGRQHDWSNPCRLSIQNYYAYSSHSSLTANSLMRIRNNPRRVWSFHVAVAPGWCCSNKLQFYLPTDQKQRGGVLPIINTGSPKTLKD